MVGGPTLVTAYMLMGDTPVSNPDPVAHVNLLGGVSRLFTVSQDVPLRTPLLTLENVGESMNGSRNAPAAAPWPKPDGGDLLYRLTVTW